MLNFSSWYALEFTNDPVTGKFCLTKVERSDNTSSDSTQRCYTNTFTSFGNLELLVAGDLNSESHGYSKVIVTLSKIVSGMLGGILPS